MPAANDVVLVPAGISVVYAGVGASAIDSLRVDGLLRFATAQSSTLTLDTLEVTMAGELRIGTVADPVQPQADIRIVFRSDSDIDIVWDPDLLSRGLMAHGRVQVHGQRKTVHTKLAVNPTAGSSTLTLAEAPQNWRVGDRLVLTGTRYSGWKWDNAILAVRYHGTQDEVLTITSISGATVGVSPPLVYSHATPRADLKASVTNFSRNVTFSSQDGAATLLHRRGHVMLMHQTGFDVRYAAFDQLGRTDKSVPSFDLDQVGTLTPTSNVRGRYPLHVHISGIDTPSRGDVPSATRVQ